MVTSKFRRRCILATFVIMLVTACIQYMRPEWIFNRPQPRRNMYRPALPLHEDCQEIELKVHNWCKRWAVVASADSEWASEAVRRQVRMYDWCLVIVFDKAPSESYDTRWFEGEGNKAVIMLTPNNLKDIGDNCFVKSCSWDYTGRKNIGYYYAITHGADIIWDFDDDNMLKFWIPGAAPSWCPLNQHFISTGQKS